MLGFPHLALVFSVTLHSSLFGFFREMDELILLTPSAWNRWLFSFRCRFSLHLDLVLPHRLHPRVVSRFEPDCCRHDGGRSVLLVVIVDASSPIILSMKGSSWVNIVSSTSCSDIIGCDCSLRTGGKEEGRRDEEDSTDSCVTATGGINFVRLCSIEICPLVNIGFFPRSHEYESQLVAWASTR